MFDNTLSFATAALKQKNITVAMNQLRKADKIKNSITQSSNCEDVFFHVYTEANINKCDHIVTETKSKLKLLLHTWQKLGKYLCLLTLILYVVLELCALKLLKLGK